MACNPDYRSPNELKMGKKVYLKMREGLYVFEKLTFWNRLKHWLRKNRDASLLDAEKWDVSLFCLVPLIRNHIVIPYPFLG